MDGLFYIFENGTLHTHSEEYTITIRNDGYLKSRCRLCGTMAKADGTIPFALSDCFSVQEVTVDGCRAEIKQIEPDIFEIENRRGLTPDNIRTIDIAYEGFLGQDIMTDHNGAIWYEFQQQTAWKPLFTLDFKGRTDVNMELTLPKGYFVCATDGDMRQSSEPDESTYLWETKGCFDFAYIAGQGLWDKASYGTCEIHALVMDDAPYRPGEVLSAACDILPFYESLFGRYPYCRLSIACPPVSVSGNTSREGLAVVGCLGSNSPLSRIGYSMLAHEISHMWWGYEVFFDMSHIGLFEPLAAYSTLRALRQHFPKSDYKKELQETLSMAKTAEQSMVPLSECTWSTPHSDWLRECKGACVLLMLEHLIGKDKMDSALHNFVAQYKGRFATARDLIDVFTNIAGSGINDFFAKYFYGTAPIPDDMEAYL